MLCWAGESRWLANYQGCNWETWIICDETTKRRRRSLFLTIITTLSSSTVICVINCESISFQETTSTVTMWRRPYWGCTWQVTKKMQPTSLCKEFSLLFLQPFLCEMVFLIEIKPYQNLGFMALIWGNFCTPIRIVGAHSQAPPYWPAFSASTCRNKTKVIMNDNCGYLMRTKVSSSNEGGVAAGFAVLDSIYLVWFMIFPIFRIVTSLTKHV